MEDKIYRYPLKGIRAIEVAMPAPAIPLHVGVQDGGIQVWARVGGEPGAIDIVRTFDIYPTGETLRDFPGTYLGTVQIRVFVYHVYMREPGR